MQISPLQLSAFWLGKVTIEPAVQPDLSPGVQMNLETTPVFRKNDADPQNWLVDLRVNFKSAEERKIAYEGSVEMTGSFQIAGDASQEKLLEIIAVNGPSILYSSIREFVAMVTAHGRNGKFVLPSVSFIDQKLLPPAAQHKKT